MDKTTQQYLDFEGLSLYDSHIKAYIQDHPGAQGETGLQGITGEKGADGEQGVTGFQGDTGIQGETGLQGITGEKGADGEQGVTGQPGERGVDGLQGETGLQGITGEKGADGEQGKQGVTGPKGEDGQRGVDGAQGITGQPGEKGVDGLQGESGKQGVTGLKGEDGQRGVDGLQGVTGQSGEKGADGAQGVTGLQGVTGPSLVAGTKQVYVDSLMDFYMYGALPLSNFGLNTQDVENFMEGKLNITISAAAWIATLEFIVATAGSMIGVRSIDQMTRLILKVFRVLGSTTTSMAIIYDRYDTSIRHLIAYLKSGDPSMLINAEYFNRYLLNIYIACLATHLEPIRVAATTPFDFANAPYAGNFFCNIISSHINGFLRELKRPINAIYFVSDNYVALNGFLMDTGGGPEFETSLLDLTANRYIAQYLTSLYNLPQSITNYGLQELYEYLYEHGYSHEIRDIATASNYDDVQDFLDDLGYLEQSDKSIE